VKAGRGKLKLCERKWELGPFRMRALGPRDEDVEDEMDSCFR